MKGRKLLFPGYYRILGIQPVSFSPNTGIVTGPGGK